VFVSMLIMTFYCPNVNGGIQQKGHVMSDMTLKAEQERQGWTRLRTSRRR
jgi:hypothetical protein